VEIEPKDGQDEQGSQQYPDFAKDDGEGELERGQDGYEGRPIGGVNPICTAPAGDHTLAHQDGFLVNGLPSQG
jgi:hypothetical protein